MKLTIPIEILERKDGTLLIKCLTGFGEPCLRVDEALVVIVEEPARG